MGPYFGNEPKDETLSTSQCYNDLFSLARDIRCMVYKETVVLVLQKCL